MTASIVYPVSRHRSSRLTLVGTLPLTSSRSALVTLNCSCEGVPSREKKASRQRSPRPSGSLAHGASSLVSAASWRSLSQRAHWWSWKSSSRPNSAPSSSQRSTNFGEPKRTRPDGAPNTANAHAMLATFCGLNSSRRSQLSMARCSNSSSSQYPAVANAHAMFARPCGENRLKRGAMPASRAMASVAIPSKSAGAEKPAVA